MLKARLLGKRDLVMGWARAVVVGEERVSERKDCRRGDIMLRRDVWVDVIVWVVEEEVLWFGGVVESLEISRGRSSSAGSRATEPDVFDDILPLVPLGCCCVFGTSSRIIREVDLDSSCLQDAFRST